MLQLELEPSLAHVDDLPFGDICSYDLSRGGATGRESDVGNTRGGHDWSTLISRRCQPEEDEFEWRWGQLPFRGAIDHYLFAYMCFALLQPRLL